MEAMGAELRSSRSAPGLHPARTLAQNPYADQVLRDFRHDEYLRANPDLHFDDPQQALWHFVFTGHDEGRVFDRWRADGVDPGWYRRRYPELQLRSDAEAVRHYSYHGYYEHRLPNPDTAWVHDAELHLFQMGKVGSHAIARGLERGYPGRVVHVHWAAHFPLGYPGCRIAYPRVLAHPRHAPVKVISAAREIVSRVLSGHLQYLDTRPGAVGDSLTREQVEAHIEANFDQDCDIVASWFDHGYYCGLDVYAVPFPHDKGCVRLQHDALDLLIYRQEDLGRLESEIGAFIEWPGFRLQQANAASGKSYAELHAWLMATFTLHGNTLARLYDTPYMRHFYSEQEREQFLHYWRMPRLPMSLPEEIEPALPSPLRPRGWQRLRHALLRRLRR